MGSGEAGWNRSCHLSKLWNVSSKSGQARQHLRADHRYPNLARFYHFVFSCCLSRPVPPVSGAYSPYPESSFYSTVWNEKSVGQGVFCKKKSTFYCHWPQTPLVTHRKLQAILEDRPGTEPVCFTLSWGHKKVVSSMDAPLPSSLQARQVPVQPVAWGLTQQYAGTGKAESVLGGTKQP